MRGFDGGRGGRSFAAFAERVSKFFKRTGSGSGGVLKRMVRWDAAKCAGIYDGKRVIGFGRRRGDVGRDRGRNIGRKSDRSGDRSFAGKGIGVDVCDDGALGRLEPFAILGDVREQAHGSKNGAGGGGRVVDVFENAFGDAAKIAAAAGDEAEGLGVTVEAGEIRQEIFAADAVRVAPADEFVVDGCAIGVIADEAFASVAAEADGVGALRVGSSGIAG